MEAFKFDFKGKIALITGSSDGIGAATAILFSSLGAKVAIVGRTKSKLDKVARECEARSPCKFKPLVIQADFEKDEDIKRTFTETIDKFMQLDILINNVGGVSHKGFEDTTMIDDYDRVMQVNVRSVVLLTQLAKFYLYRLNGVIVNVSSIASVKPNVSFWSYCMTKAALDMFTKTMASLLGPEVRVNSVNPGPVKTNILSCFGPSDKVWATMSKETALERVGNPDEIAKVIVFLASDAAKNMTGSIVVCDSGLLVNDSHKNDF